MTPAFDLLYPAPTSVTIGRPFGRSEAAEMSPELDQERLAEIHAEVVDFLRPYAGDMSEDVFAVLAHDVARMRYKDETEHPARHLGMAEAERLLRVRSAPRQRV